MRSRLVLPALVGALALVSVTCAPHDDTPPPAPKPAAVLPEGLKPRIDAALESVHARDLRTSNGFWTIFHGILGMGPDATLLDEKTRQRVNALDSICAGADIRGLSFRPSPNGVDVETMVGSGVGQGHQDQFVAEMAQWGMPAGREFHIDGKKYTFADFVRESKMRTSIKKGQELSWAIVILGQYYGTDLAWTNADGDKLAYEDVVRYELDQPIESAACGGTHRLFGLTWALHLRRAKGESAGVWKDAAEKIALYKGKAIEYQNGDGSFSSAYVSKPGLTSDPQQRIATTGHVLEWLSLAMTDEELTSPKMQEAASALAAMILQNQNSPLDGGGLYHATHGLHIYRTRVFKTPPPRGLLIPPAR